MAKKCGFALIGYGGMGHWHMKRVVTLPELEVCGIYDIDPKRVEETKQDGFHAYSSLEEVLADDRVSLVTIAIPNDMHKPVAIAAMNAGKNVICEKPVTLSCSDLQEMIDASHRNNVIFTVHQNRRWDKDFLITKKIYDDNELGGIFNIQSRVQGSRGIPGDWRNTKEHGGGMVLDWGVHLLDQMLQINKTKIVSVYAETTNITNEVVDDGFCSILKFEDGMTATVEVGTSNFISLPRWYIQGRDGTAVVENWALDGRIIKVSDWSNSDAVPIVTAAGLTKTMAPRTPDTIKEFPLPDVESDVRDFYRNVFKAMCGTETQIVKHEELMRVMKLMEAIFKSSETSQVIHEEI